MALQLRLNKACELCAGSGIDIRSKAVCSCVSQKSDLDLRKTSRLLGLLNGNYHIKSESTYDTEIEEVFLILQMASIIFNIVSVDKIKDDLSSNDVIVKAGIEAETQLVVVNNTGLEKDDPIFKKVELLRNNRGYKGYKTLFCTPLKE